MKNFLLFLAAIFLMSASAQAADFTVATVDISTVINRSSEAKKAKVELDAATNKAKKLIEEKRIALQPLEEKARKGSIKPGTKEGNEIKAKTSELVELMRTKEDELRQAFMKANRGIAEKTNKAISAYAKENKISLVLDRGDGTRGGVLFGDDSFDITEEIISRVNR